MKAMKKPVILDFYFADETHTISTLEGKVTARQDDAVLTGTAGESWTIKRTTFEETYNILGPGKCSKKPIVVQASLMTSEFEVPVGWSNEPLKGKPGDWKLEYSPNDFGVVNSDIFNETYVLL